jgi:amino acid transporter
LLSACQKLTDRVEVEPRDLKLFAPRTGLIGLASPSSLFASMFTFLFPLFPFHSVCTGQHETFDRSTMLSFGILVGLLTALVCVIIGIVAVLKIRTANNKKSNNKQRPGNLPIKEKISVPLSQSEEMYDEKNPDVVPSNEGKNKM